MDDKNLMEDLLLTVKGACDLYMHGTIESSTQTIHSTFDTALDDALKTQNDIYTKMSEKGWYPAEKAEQQKIQQAAQKFSNMNA